jgi:hypothetical protein
MILKIQLANHPGMSDESALTLRISRMADTVSRKELTAENQLVYELHSQPDLHAHGDSPQVRYCLE